jgi:hypothetical protein
MSARLHFIVEGQTEETFVNSVLAPHLGLCSVWANARCVTTSRHRNKVYRGGMTSYSTVRKDIIRWMKEDQNPDAVFTTMFDLYALPQDFPGYGDASKSGDPYRRVALIEEAMRRDIQHPRFIPYIQLYEFEALLLADPQKLEWEYLERDAAIRKLVEMVSGFKSPELIDDGNETAPSKRIIREIPEYEGMKASAGPLVTEKIGLTTLRAKCEHFNEWLVKLETFGQGQLSIF